MDVETKLAVVRSFAQEIVTAEDLKHLFETNDHPIVYDGFEPSGGMAPIHFGLLRAKNLKKMLDIGVHFKLFLADYYAFINNKLEGNMDHIRKTGEYFIEVWRACGIDMSKVEVIWAKDLMDRIDYWDRFIRVGRSTTIDRIRRAITIMGRREGEAVSAAQLFYPAMQVTDVFQLDIDICEMGMEQRKANILAREIAQKEKWHVPVAVHHPLMLGLQGMPQQGAGENDRQDAAIEYKMSKSNPKSAIYVHDSYETIKKKINGAYCPERVVDGNPLFNYLELVIIEDRTIPIAIDRPQKFGGPIEFSNYADMVEKYKEGKLHPADLKAYVADGLEKLISPARGYFEKNKRAGELYKEVSGYMITR
jgi:tyrosyl-tRNA synthetase